MEMFIVVFMFSPLHYFGCFHSRAPTLRPPPPPMVYGMGSLSDNDGDGYERVTEKVNSRYFKLYRAYSTSFNSSNVGECYWIWILKDSIRWKEKKKKVVLLCSRPPENVKLGMRSFTS